MRVAVACEHGTPALGRFGRGADIFVWTGVEAPECRKVSDAHAGCCSALAQSIPLVDVVICGTISNGALARLVQRGIGVVVAGEDVSTADQAVKAWTSGRRDLFRMADGTPCDHAHAHAHDHDHDLCANGGCS